MTVTNKMPSVHPGEILREEMEERDLSANALALALGTPDNRITTILNGHRGGSADTARGLSRCLFRLSKAQSAVSGASSGPNCLTSRPRRTTIAAPPPRPFIPSRLTPTTDRARPGRRARLASRESWHSLARVR